ncbi:MAG TPA: 7-carboxy-7-deazaguanine synthase QueE, partial [Bacteroidia bacterium]|nr:7-carboxy-7-deazaguanine synthase QueE [Bacteroidia bacterium]
MSSIASQISTLPVMESFYTIQGEGYHSGKPAYFIRLAGCDVGCVWCDVKESWTTSENQYQTVDTIVEGALQYPVGIVVITGGEPCMYNLEPLTTKLHEKGFRIHLETSGAYSVKGNLDWIC